MDFLKKKMKELMDEDDKPKKEEKKDEHRDVDPSAPSANQQQPYQQQPPQGFPQQHYPQPGGYHQQGGYPQQGYPQQGYQQQPPYGQYGSPPPPQGPPAPYGAPPPMPPGWLAQWDQNSQRWYYVDQSTGRTQWDPPAGAPPPQGPYAPPPPGAPGPQGASNSYYQGAPYGAPAGTPGAHDERALFGNTQGYDQGHAGNYGDTKDGEKSKDKDKDKDKDKSKKGHSTAMLAAVGVGGIAAGALIGHEMTEDSDDEKKNTTYVTNNYGTDSAAPLAAGPVAAAPLAAAPYAPAPGFEEPPPVPRYDADGDSISSSDREELEERREELIEAQREYEEELEEAYDD